MGAQSFFVDFLGKSSTPALNAKKNTQSSSRFSSKFVDNLNTEIEKSSVYRNDRKSQGSIKYNSDNKSVKSSNMDVRKDVVRKDNRFKTYKEVITKKDEITSKNEVIKTVNENGEFELEEDTVKSEETIIEESLAGILNISIKELESILSTLNLDNKDLTDQTKTAEIAQKISDLFGLNSDQNKTLTKLMEFIVEESKSLVQKTKTQGINSENRVDKDGWVKLEGIDVEVVELDQKLQLENQTILKSELEKTLNTLQNKLNSDPKKLFEGILSKIEETVVSNVKTADISVEQKNVVEDLAVTKLEEESDTKLSTTSGESGKSEEKEADTNTSSDAKAQSIEFKESETVGAGENVSQNTQKNEFGNVLSDQQIKLDGTDEISKVQSKVNVSKKEIITQIVDKAKVVLSDEKSEMLIDLKPDHLGKLSLKVVTERGMVIAKFEAESEQVKAAIESSMDNLKESLTKQGFSIEGFSVSVRQDSKKSFYDGHENSQNGSRSNKGDKIISTASVGLSAIEENQMLNPYMVNSNSINLTA